MTDDYQNRIATAVPRLEPYSTTAYLTIAEVEARNKTRAP
jgi:hypothetical protein